LRAAVDGRAVVPAACADRRAVVQPHLRILLGLRVLGGVGGAAAGAGAFHRRGEGGRDAAGDGGVPGGQQPAAGAHGRRPVAAVHRPDAGGQRAGHVVGDRPGRGGAAGGCRAGGGRAGAARGQGRGRAGLPSACWGAAVGAAGCDHQLSGCGGAVREGPYRAVPRRHVRGDVEPFRAAVAVAGVPGGSADGAEGRDVISGELKWYTVASRLEQAAYNALTDTPDRHGVVPGAIAWDACDCGMLAVSIAQVYPSETFPDPQAAPVGACQAPWEVAEVVVQIIRCAPNAEGQSLYPTAAALDA